MKCSKLFKQSLSKNAEITLVLLHGNSSSSKVFSHFIKNVTSDINVVAFDLPGHGNSKHLNLFCMSVSSPKMN